MLVLVPHDTVSFVLARDKEWVQVPTPPGSADRDGDARAQNEDRGWMHDSTVAPASE